MKRILLVTIVLMLIVVAQAAHAVYLDSSWYAQITNIQTYGNYHLGAGLPTSSAHIGVSGSASALTFSIIQAGQATSGERAYWWDMTVAPPHTMGSISFDFATYWTQPNLCLVLTQENLQEPYSQVVWTSWRTGTRSGHVTIDANPNGYMFSLVVVPEPSSMLALGSLCALGLAGRMRRRFHVERKLQ